MRLQFYLDAKYKYFGFALLFFGFIIFCVRFLLFLGPCFLEKYIFICKFNCIAFRFRQHALNFLLSLIQPANGVHFGVCFFLCRFLSFILWFWFGCGGFVVLARGIVFAREF